MPDRSPRSRETGSVGRAPGPSTERPERPNRTEMNGWQVLAIAALVAATAGWTTVAVMALQSPATGAVDGPTPTGTFDPTATDAPVPPPVGETHDAPELEVLLPSEIDDIRLEIQSWTGVALIADDPWSESMRAFLTGVDRLPVDLHVAQGYDPDEVLQGSVGVYALPGVDPADVRDALLAAWGEEYPDMTISEIVIDGRKVTEAGFGEDTASSFLYVRDDVVFDIETTERSLAEAALAALPEGPAGRPSPATTSAPGPSGS